ncbi:MAG: hypothetical protein LBR34_12470 [Prevotella sp.]|jgi:hypothetical protein|nr:hypothetical protein [Prevotella sp.]
MKIFLQQLTIGGALLLFLGVGEAWGATYEYTFTSKIWSADGEQTLNGIKWTATNGAYWAYDATKGQQFGSNNNLASNLTLTTSDFFNPITSVKVSTAGNASISASFSVSVGGTVFTYNGNTSASITATNTEYEFTGSATTGEIVIQYGTVNKGLYVKKIEVTYTTSCTNPNLSFGISGGVVYKTTDAANFTQTASSDNLGEAITYSSSEPSVATVNSSTGEVSIVGKGITTITAAQSSDATYCAGEDDYTLVVGSEFQLVTQNSQLIADGEYILVGKKSENDYYALGKQAANNRTAISISVSTASPVIVPVATAATDETNIYMLKLTGSAGAWILNDVINSTILGSAITDDAGNNRLYQNDDAQWTISVGGDSKVAMTCTNGNADDRNVLKFNGTSALFACYLSSYATGIGELYLYATPETIANAPSALNSATAGDAVVSAKYYTLQGVEVAAPQSGGVYIAKQIHASGKVSAAKVWLKN